MHHQYLKIGVSSFQIYRLDPNIAVADIVTFSLKFNTAWGVGDSFSTIVTAIDA
jgi:hypothetical protein